MSSITSNLASRLAISTYITALHFKSVVIKPTMQAISEADKVTVGLVASTVCQSTFLLLLAADAAAKQIIKNRNSKKSNSHNIKEKTTPAEDPIDHKLTASITETSISTARIHSTDLESETTTRPPSPAIPSTCPQNIKEDLHYPVPNHINLHSFDSATTLVAGSDDDDDGGEVFHKVTMTPKPSSKPAQDEADTMLPAPGSRTKARIATLRRRTHAIIDWLPATTESSIGDGLPATRTAAKRAPAAPAYRPIPMTWPSLRRQGRVGWIP